MTRWWRTLAGESEEPTLQGGFFGLQVLYQFPQPVQMFFRLSKFAVVALPIQPHCFSVDEVVSVFEGRLVVRVADNHVCRLPVTSIRVLDGTSRPRQPHRQACSPASIRRRRAGCLPPVPARASVCGFRSQSSLSSSSGSTDNANCRNAL